MAYRFVQVMRQKYQLERSACFCVWKSKKKRKKNTFKSTFIRSTDTINLRDKHSQTSKDHSLLNGFKNNISMRSKPTAVALGLLVGHRVN